MPPRRPTRPLVLLPPSKGKAAGGDGPGYGRTLRAAHPLHAARRLVLDALAEDVATLDDAQLARVSGVAAKDLDAAREQLPELAGAPTMAAHRRYTGIVHGNAGLAELDPATAASEVRIVSPLLGLAALDEPVPYYRLEATGSLPSTGGLGVWWREQLADHLAALGRGVRVWDLLPGEFQRVVAREVRAGWDAVSEIRFVRPDGRAANAARTKVAKGNLAGLLARRAIDDPDELVEVAAPGEGWRLRRDGDDVLAVSHH